MDREQRVNIKDYSSHEIKQMIDEWVLSERDRSILKRRYIDGLLYKELAEEFHLSERWTKEIVRRETKRIFRHYP